YDLRFTIYDLRFTIYELRITSWDLTNARVHPAGELRKCFKDSATRASPSSPRWGSVDCGDRDPGRRRLRSLPWAILVRAVGADSGGTVTFKHAQAPILPDSSEHGRRVDARRGGVGLGECAE